MTLMMTLKCDSRWSLWTRVCVITKSSHFNTVRASVDLSVGPLKVLAVEGEEVEGKSSCALSRDFKFLAAYWSQSNAQSLAMTWDIIMDN